MSTIERHVGRAYESLRILTGLFDERSVVIRGPEIYGVPELDAVAEDDASVGSSSSEYTGYMFDHCFFQCFIVFHWKMGYIGFENAALSFISCCLHFRKCLSLDCEFHSVHSEHG